MILFSKKKSYPLKITRAKGSETVQMEAYLNDKRYHITDRLPDIKWNIIPGETKTILGYVCKKATADFRGSRIAVYFTEELNVSAGPFKLAVPNGLILALYEEGSEINRWEAVAIETKLKKRIYPKPGQKAIPVTMQEFISLQNDYADREFHKQVKAPPGVKIERIPLKRTALEKAYEWEK